MKFLFVKQDWPDGGALRALFSQDIFEISPLKKDKLCVEHSLSALVTCCHLRGARRRRRAGAGVFFANRT